MNPGSNPAARTISTDDDGSISVAVTIDTTHFAIALLSFSEKRELETHDNQFDSHAMVYLRQIAYLNFFIQYRRTCPKRRA
jgi:hypothetical protein